MKRVSNVIALDFQQQLAFLDVIAQLGIKAGDAPGSQGDHRNRQIHIGIHCAGGVYLRTFFPFARRHQRKALGIIDFNKIEVRLFDHFRLRRRLRRFVHIGF